MSTTTRTQQLRATCPKCDGHGWTVADMGEDGNGHWAWCDCRPEPAAGRIQCAPFCEDDNGHAAASTREDQWCRGAAMSIPLPAYRLAAVDPYDPFGLYADQLEVLPVRRWERGQNVEYVLIHQDAADSELTLTAAQARELAVNLLLAIGELTN